MIYNYEEVISKYEANYQLDKAIENKEIFKIEQGLYFEQEFINS